MYLFAGILNTDTWWGIRNDSYTTHAEIIRLGVDEFISIGDKDRAVHIARGEMLRKGMRLTNATKILCDRFGVRETVLPMTDSEVTTQVKTDPGLIHFQEYWVRAKGKIDIEKVVRSYVEPPIATEEVLSVIDASDTVIIGPSNPITSISPILACEGIKNALLEKFVIAVSPFIGNAPISGPAGALMQAEGFEPATLEIRDGGPDGPVLFSYAMGTGTHPYRPVPHVVHVGAPIGRSGAAAATVPGMIVRNVWVSPSPRPTFANQ